MATLDGILLYCSVHQALKMVLTLVPSSIVQLPELVFGEREAAVMASSLVCDSAVLPCLCGCLAFLPWHFPPQSPPSSSLGSSPCRWQQTSPWDCSPIRIIQLPAAALYRDLHTCPSLVAQMVKHLPTMREIRVQSLGWEDFLEKEMATHSSILAWKIPLTEEPGRLQSMGSQSQTQLSDFICIPVWGISGFGKDCLCDSHSIQLVTCQLMQSPVPLNASPLSQAIALMGDLTLPQFPHSLGASPVLFTLFSPTFLCPIDFV